MQGTSSLVKQGETWLLHGRVNSILVSLSQFKTEHFNQVKVKLLWQLVAAASWAWPLCRTLHLALAP
jgi:hypothetical protein